MSLTKIAIVVPFYNENDNLIFFVKEWEKFLDKNINLRKVLFFYFINDGSIDNSKESLKKNIKKLKYFIVDKVNSGHGDTCKYGYELIIKSKTNYSYILQIDSDNQCDPKYLIEFINQIKKNNFRFIFGYRKKRYDGYLRSIISKLLSLSIFLKKFVFIKDLNTPYRLMETNSLRNVMNLMNKKKKYKNIILFNCVLAYEINNIYQIKWININFRKRKFGKSKFNFFDMLRIYLNLFYYI